MKQKSFYNIDVLAAMYWTIMEWNNCLATVIKNCFIHSLKQNLIIEKMDKRINMVNLTAKMNRDREEHCISVALVGIKNFTQP